MVTGTRMQLNPSQLEAVTWMDGPLKIVAGAGTGKTGTLTRRFAYLVEQGVPADRILALTFSRRAATELRERTLDLLDTSYHRLWFGTFHSFCLRVLREERELFGRVRVMGEQEQRRAIMRVIRDDPEAVARTHYAGESGGARLVEDALTLISRTKDEGISAVDFAEYADRRGVARLRELANIYLAYKDLCRRETRLDFGDLASVLVEAFGDDGALLERWRERFDQVMVDEFQDVNEVQWRLLTLLAPPPDGNLAVVGDSCQAIYAFRGASCRFFDRFEVEYHGARSIVLKTNYRSRQRILDVAHALISGHEGERAHHLTCDSGDAGEPVRFAGLVDEDAEADYIARSILRLTTHERYVPSDCAVLCRSAKNAAGPFVRAFSAYGIPFQVRGYDPSVTDAIEDLRAALNCLLGSATWVDAARVLVRRQVALHDLQTGLPLDALAQRYAELLGPNQELLRAVPALDALTYGRVTDWLDGAESWRPIAEVRNGLPAGFERAAEALARLEAACAWLRTQCLETQVYAALALVGRLAPASHASAGGRAGASACRVALRIAHGAARAGLGLAAVLHDLALVGEEERELGERAAADAVSILTLHGAKGLEWPVVFMPGLAAGNLPAPLRLDRAFDLDDLSEYVRRGRQSSVAEVAAVYVDEPERERAGRFVREERRLAYVGCTRARQRLFVTYAASYDQRETVASPFLADLQSADAGAWVIDEQSDAGVLLPLDVARATRQSALAALGVSCQTVLPPILPDPSDLLTAVLSAQWTASRVAGGVPIRFRALPEPYVAESILTVSFSGLDAYQSCPRQFFYRQVLHIDAPVRGANVTLGNKLHESLRVLNQQWMEQGSPPADDEVIAVWRSIWPVDAATLEAAKADPATRMQWAPGFLFTRQLAQGWQRGLKNLRRYYRWEHGRHAQDRQRMPIALEESFVIPYKDHFIDGRIDCVLRTSAGDLIVDYKSGKKSSNNLKADTSLQLAVYERAWQADPRVDAAHPASAAYYFLARKDDRGDRVSPEWDTGDQMSVANLDETKRAFIWSTIDDMLTRIAANDFAAQPASGKATCERCAYRTWCDESLA